VFLENPKHVDVVLEERQLREIAMVAKNRSEFIRDAIDLALGHKDFAAVHKLREENEKLRRENEELRRENEELKRQLEEAAELIEILKGERKAQGLDAKRYQTSFGWLTAEEIKQLFERKKPRDPLEWLSAVLYNDAVAIQEVAAYLGLQTPSSAISPVLSTLSAAEVAAKNENTETASEAASEAASETNSVERERIERKLKARDLRRRRRMLSEIDFKALAEELGCSEEEARERFLRRGEGAHVS